MATICRAVKRKTQKIAPMRQYAVGGGFSCWQAFRAIATNRNARESIYGGLHVILLLASMFLLRDFVILQH